MSTPYFKRGYPTIGVLAGWSTLEGAAPDYYRTAVIRGIQSAARVRKCHLMLAWGMTRNTEAADRIHPAWPDCSPDMDFVPVGPWNTDGLIVFNPLCSEARSAYIQGLISSGHPVIFIAEGERGATISVNSKKGISQAVAHLAEHGHQDIAFIAGVPQDGGDSGIRLGAFREAMAEHALPINPGLIEYGRHVVWAGYDAMKKILASGLKFTAVIASNDNSAIGAMRAIREAGLQIPGDIAVMGFDDQPDAVVQTPPLSSVHVPLNVIGEQALVTLHDHLTGQGPLESVRVSTRLMLRRSCGCMPRPVSSVIEEAPGIDAPVPRRTRTSRNRESPQSKKDRLVNKMLTVLPSELRFPGEESFRLIAASLVDAFFSCLEKSDPSRFRSALIKFLDDLEQAESIEPWQEMISVLRLEMKQLPLNWGDGHTRRMAEDLLHQARVVVGESASLIDQRRQYRQEIAAKALSELTARLSAALDEQQAVDVLDAHLADVGVRHARVVLLEADDSDPVARSVVLNKNAESLHKQHFASREFPPKELYPHNELLNLLLLPLVFQDEALGYMAFDASDLEPCAVIARQMAATIKASRLHAQVTELSLTDPLTGLYNRRYLDLFLKNGVHRHQRFARGLAVVLLDLDNFKGYNDTYGHPAGDEVLKLLAECLTQDRRSSDMVARLGGDEFVLVLPETDSDGALEVIRKIRARIAGLQGIQRPISASFGLTIPHGAGLEAGSLVKQADHALYEAKRSGRDRVIVFDGEGEKVEKGASRPR